jgi:hypothetical protein
MRARFLIVACALMSALIGISSHAQQGVPAPTYIPQTQFDSGQDIVPVYEGWIRNADGSFDFVFGYFNRNFKQELAIPAGTSNDVEPDGPDRGQPTYFLPRHEARLFRAHVPKDWGQKTLTWSITANGRTEKAYADLRAVEEINESIMQSGGNSVPFEPGNANPNRAPTLSLAAVSIATVSAPVTLTANVTDDGLPKPRAPQVAAPPVVTKDANGREIQRQANSSGGGRGRGGLTVRWIEYGGPARVVLTPPTPVPVSNGTAAVSAQFTAPGAYKLVAMANDGQLSTSANATVNVK